MCRGRQARCAGAVSLLLIASACGEAGGPAAFSPGEAADLVAALFSQLDVASSGAPTALLSRGSSPADGPRFDIIPFGPQPIDDDVACPQGGSVSTSGTMSGEIDTEAGTISGSLTADVDVADCGLDLESGVARLSGPIELDGTLTFSGSSGSARISVVGYVDVELEGGTQGRCTLDLVERGTFSGEGVVDREVSGDACGQSVRVSPQPPSPGGQSYRIAVLLDLRTTVQATGVVSSFPDQWYVCADFHVGNASALAVKGNPAGSGPSAPGSGLYPRVVGRIEQQWALGTYSVSIVPSADPSCVPEPEPGGWIPRAITFDAVNASLTLRAEGRGTSVVVSSPQEFVFYANFRAED